MRRIYQDPFVWKLKEDRIKIANVLDKIQVKISNTFNWCAACFTFCMLLFHDANN